MIGTTGLTTIENKPVTKYLGIVTVKTISETNIIRCHKPYIVNANYMHFISRSYKKE